MAASFTHVGDQHSKGALRAEIAARRRARPQAERDAAATALADRVLALPEMQAVRTVTAYESFPTEPGTGPLLAALSARGVRVLLPVLRADNDLAWVADGRALGIDAVGVAQALICPAVAATRGGLRLGRGGGSYDRVLARVGRSTLTVALLHDDEVVDDVPTQPHDRGVDVVVTPTRTLRSRGDHTR
jgi:5-formyltetrahydrofolate cyclo-ligase